MADDNETQVKITAEAGGLKSGLNDAKSLNKSVADAMKADWSSASSSISGSIQKMQAGITSSFSSIKASLGGLGIAMATSLAAATKSALDHEKSLMQFSRVTGMAIQDASEWSFAAQMSGVSTDSFSTAVMMLARGIGGAEKSMDSGKDKFSEYGVAVKDANGVMLPTSQILENIAQRYQSLPPGMERTTFAFSMFRGEAKAMIPLLNQGAEGIQKLKQQAEQYGLVVRDTDGLKAYTSAQRQMSLAVQGFNEQIGNALMPAMTAFSTAVSNVAKAFTAMDPTIKNTIINVVAIGGPILAVVGGLAALRAALNVLGFEKLASALNLTINPLAAVKTGIDLLTGATKSVWLAISALPAAIQGGVTGIRLWASWTGVATVSTTVFWTAVTAGIAVIAGLAIAWYTNFNGIREATASSLTAIGNAFTSLWEHIKQIGTGILNVLKGAFSMNPALMQEGINTATGAFSAAIGDMSDIGKNAWDGFKTAGSTVMDGLKKFITPDLTVTPPGGDENGDYFTPDFGGGSGKEPKEKSGPSAYETAKQQYEAEAARQQAEAELNNQKYTLDQKLALYLQYLADVEKSDKELSDYEKGLYELTTEDHREQMELRRAQLEKEIAESKLTKKEQYDQELELLQEEVNNTLEGSKERIQAETKVINKKKEYANYLSELAQKERDLSDQAANDVISNEEKKYQILYDQGQISQAQLLAIQKNLEEERYKIESAGLDDRLEANAVDLDKMKDDYRQYVNARTDADRQLALDEMVANAKNTDDLMSTLKSIEQAYSQHTGKIMDLDNQVWKEEQKNILEVKSTLTDSMSQGLQDIVNRTSTFLGVLHSMWSSVMNSILKQLTNSFSKGITDKMFAGALGGNSDSGVIKKAKDSQNTITKFTQQGASQRAAINTAASQQEITATQTKTTTETALETTKDQAVTTSAAASGAAVTASSTAAGAAAVQSIQASIQAMLQMLPTLLILSAITGLFGGGGSKTTESTSSTNLGRNPDSYYSTPKSAFSLPSFDIGAWKLPRDMVSLVHENELIVPTQGGMADNVRSLLAGGLQPAAATSSPTFNLNYTAAHYGRTNADVQNEMKQNARFLVKTLNQEWRNFNRGKK